MHPKASFLAPLPLSLRGHSPSTHAKTRMKRARVRCQTDATPPPPPPPPEPTFGRFDASSETDAFGRDPKKETEFWKGAARSVLASDEVQRAITEHAKGGGDGLTDEQAGYAEFLQALDDEKEKEKEEEKEKGKDKGKEKGV